MSDLALCPATELAAMIRRRAASSREVVEAALARVDAHNPRLNAIVTLDRAGALRQADQADAALARGEVPGPLHGVPMTVKDVFETAGLRTTAGHPPLRDHTPTRDATVVARLRAAGAIVLGKTNLPELAMDTQCESALFGVTRNPWDAARTPGGSSGGEAVAVATGMSALGVGSDLGGSVRIPAHCCGLFSLKPTEGRISRAGHIPPLPGDPGWLRHAAVCGPMARSVSDLRLALQLMAGPDGRDLGVAPAPLAEAPPVRLEGLRLAWTDSLGDLPVAAEVRAATAALAEQLTAAGARVERATPPDFDAEAVWETYGELVGTMLAASLPAGPRAALRLLGPLVAQGDRISQAGARRVFAGMADFVSVLDRRDRLTRALDAFLAGYDAWLLPVAATPAPPLRRAGRINTPVEVDGVMQPGHLAAIGLTCPFNLTGHPAVVLPLPREGLPIGVQLVGPRWGEMALLAVAEAVAAVTGGFRAPPGI
ncbi:MAG: amidase [Alphaproteobacteria bacterium]|nr:amidase [Alphaproteobacteria bacterium]